MNSMVDVFQSLLILVWNLNASASFEQLPDKDLPPMQAMKAINVAAAAVDPATLAAMKTTLREFAQASESGFLKMSAKTRKTTYLTCTIGNAGFTVGFLGGLCLADGQVVLLRGVGLPAKIGVAGSLLLGVVRADAAGVEAIRGEYKGPSLGAAGLRQIAEWADYSRKLRIGYGVHVIHAIGDTGQELSIAGPSLGVIFDISRHGFRID